MANEIWVYDVIGAGFFDDGVTAKGVRDELAKFDAKDRITVRINSPGGDAFEAVAIGTLLSQHRGGVDVQIDGVAASAASYLATFGDKVTMAKDAMLMIHRAWSGGFGNASDLRAQADLLEKVDGVLASAYVRRSGQKEAAVKAALDAETWFTADEAIEFGLVDGTAEVKAAAFKIPAEFGYKHAPQPAAPSPTQRNVASVAAMKRKLDLTRARLGV